MRRGRGRSSIGSVREILQMQQKVEREREMLGWAARWFDAIFVHGDPRFARFEETFSFADELRPPVHYTGFVFSDAGRTTRRRRSTARRDEVVVSAGGGGVGHRAARDGARRTAALALSAT